jgi:hypothetical protein
VFDNTNLTRSRDVNIAESQVADRIALKASHLEDALCIINRQVLDDDVADYRVKIAGVTLFIVVIDDDCVLDFADRDITISQVLDHTTSHGICLDADRAFEVRAAHTAVFGEHIAYAAGDFTTDNDTAVPCSHVAIGNHNILAGRIDAPTVGITA